MNAIEIILIAAIGVVVLIGAPAAIGEAWLKDQDRQLVSKMEEARAEALEEAAEKKKRLRFQTPELESF